MINLLISFLWERRRVKFCSLAVNKLRVMAHKEGLSTRVRGDMWGGDPRHAYWCVPGSDREPRSERRRRV